MRPPPRSAPDQRRHPGFTGLQDAPPLASGDRLRFGRRRPAPSAQRPPCVARIRKRLPAHHLLPPRAHQPPPAGARIANAKPDRSTLTGSDGLSYPVVNSSAFTTTTEAGPSATTPLHDHRQPCGSGKPNKRSADDDGDDVDPEALAAYRDRHGARRRSRERSPSPRSRARAVAPKRDEPYLGNKVSSSAYPRRSDNRRSR